MGRASHSRMCGSHQSSHQQSRSQDCWRLNWEGEVEVAVRIGEAGWADGRGDCTERQRIYT